MANQPTFSPNLTGTELYSFHPFTNIAMNRDTKSIKWFTKNWTTEERFLQKCFSLHLN